MSNYRNPADNTVHSSQSIVTLQSHRLTDSHHPSNEVEQQMIVEIDKVIGRYLSRPDWSSPYLCTFEWHTQGRYIPKYAVKVVIKEPPHRT